MATPIQPTRSDQASFNIKEFFFKYLRFLPLFLLSLSLSMAIAFFYLRYKTPTYRSSGQLILKVDNDKGISDDKFQQLFVDDRSKNIQNEIEYLKSTPLLERVVEKLELNMSYYTQGKIKEQNVYVDAPFRVEILKLTDSVPFKLNVHFRNNSSFRINSEQQYHSSGQTFSTPNGVFRLIKNNTAEVSKEYNLFWNPTPVVASSLISKLLIAPKTTGSILVITLDSDNPKLASDVVNQLMKEYQSAIIEDKNITTRQTLNFLDGRLRVVSHELDSVTSTLLAYQQRNNLTDPSTMGSLYSEKAELTEQELVQQREQLNYVELIRDYLAEARNSWTRVPSTLGINDPTLSGLIGAYNTAQVERKIMLDSDIPEGNPKVKAKEEQIEKLRINLIENLRNLRSSIQSSMNTVQGRNNNAKSNLQTLPVKLQNYIEIKRQQENKLTIYNFLMSKREEAAISLAATISNVKVLNKAWPNQTPISPNRRNIQMIAFLIGLALPTLFVFISELLNDKINTRLDIEKTTSVPILGEVGHSQGISTLIVTAKNRSFIAEQFRILRSNLQYLVANVKNPVILVTSSFSGEGKSFISTNLGGVMAVAGKKTIVLEFDVRKPKILSGLNMPKRPGLTNYLLNKIKVEELPIPVDGYENLFVLSCGPIPPNPAELLLDEKLKDLFVYLRANFDVVIMDTAPVGMVGDAMTLGQFADCSIYIIRQGVTHKKQLTLVEDLNREGKLPRLSVVLNDIKLRVGYGYYGYGRYGYGYGYGKAYGYGYYDDETDTPSLFKRWFGWMSPNGQSKDKKKKATF